MKGDPAIEVQGLAFAYGEQAVLHGIDMEVAWGSVTGLLGPNGAGKSTTLKNLVGVLHPQGGIVRVAGHDPASPDLEARRVLGYVPEGGGLYPLLSGAEQLALCADLHELDHRAAEASLTSLRETLELTDLLNKRIDTLSKGQRQRIAIAAGLLHDPRVWLLDEPLSGLDAQAAAALRDLIATRAATGGAVLYCSHVLDVVERVCDQVLVLGHGRVIAQGAPDTLMAQTGQSTLEAAFRSLVGDSDGSE